MNDTIEMESGELTESLSESDNLLQNQGLLKKRSKIYRIRFRRTAPYWLTSEDNNEGWDDEDNDDEEEEEPNDISNDEELEAAMLSFDQETLVQLPVEEELEESMLEIDFI